MKGKGKGQADNQVWGYRVKKNSPKHHCTLKLILTMQSLLDRVESATRTAARIASYDLIGPLLPVSRMHPPGLLLCIITFSVKG